MYIEIKQDFECGKCGAINHVEHFSDARYRGIRCTRCGHETKSLHPHLQETSSGGSYSWANDNQITKVLSAGASRRSEVNE